MSDTRRTFLAAAAACAALSTNPPRAVANTPDVQRDVGELIERSRLANAALMRGDVDRYRELVALSDDFSLMSPFGGAPTLGRDMTDAAWARMGRFFRNGSFEQDVVEAYGTKGMVVLAIIERSNVEVGDLPAQDWSLRVTLVYRRDGSQWRLVHRHADPLVAGVGHPVAAAHARGALR